MNDLKDKIKNLPDDSGVYLMKNQGGKIIYVGKAKNLKNRVKSYFVGIENHPPKTRALVAQLTDFELILTKTEVEALLLERTLIKHHSPSYNILLRDDKQYPYLRVDFNEEWPRIEITRRRKDDGAFYLGPFGGSKSLKILIDSAERIFPLIRCSRVQFKNVRRCCNYYHMKLCLGQCVLSVDREYYISLVKDALLFIQGKNSHLIEMIKDKMQRASDEEKYELAATYRDQLAALKEIKNSRQAAIVKDVTDTDVIGFCRSDEYVSYHILMVRDGRLIGSDSFVLTSSVQDDAEALTEFLLQYYDHRGIPKELLLPLELDNIADISDVLIPKDSSGQRSSIFKILFPQKGSRKDLLEIALKNAQYNLSEKEHLSRKSFTDLENLKTFLSLDALPLKIECIDISNLQASSVVASNVCFLEGKPAKAMYRHYIIKGLDGHQDDFASIREVITRRLARGTKELNLPDLVVIDGGKGQLSAAMEAAAGYPGHPLIIALAKDRGEEGKPERVFFPGDKEPINLTPGSSEYRILAHLRDEAHRFAISHHRKRRAKAFQESELDEIPGIGPKMKKLLLETFGSLSAIKAASLEKLLSVKGLKESSAIALHSKFQAIAEEKVE